MDIDLSLSDFSMSGSGPDGVEEIVFIVGYLRETVEAWISDEYPQIEAHYVLQEVQDGTAGALHLAEPFVDEDVLIGAIERWLTPTD